MRGAGHCRIQYPRGQRQRRKGIGICRDAPCFPRHYRGHPVGAGTPGQRNRWQRRGESEKSLCRLRDFRQEIRRYRPWGHRREGSECRNPSWHGSIRIRPIYFRQCRMEPVPECKAHQQCGRHLPGMRLYYHPCAPDGGHEKNAGQRSVWHDEGWGSGPKFCKGFAGG